MEVVVCGKIPIARRKKRRNLSHYRMPPKILLFARDFAAAILPPFFFAASARDLGGAGGLWAAAAVAALFGARARRADAGDAHGINRLWRLFALAAAFAAASATVWGFAVALAAAAGVLSAESILSGDWRRRGARALCALCAVQTMLFAALPAVAPALPAYPAGAVFTVALFTLAAAFLLSLAAARAPAASGDVVLAAFCALAIFAFALTVALLAAGGIAAPRAVIYAALGFALFFAALFLLWAPFVDFGRAGVGAVASPSLATIVAPEVWLKRLAEHSQAAGDCERFVAAAMRDLVAAGKLEGAAWQIKGAGAGAVGRVADAKLKSAVFECPPLTARVFSRARVAPLAWFSLHFLIRMIAEYYVAERRGEEFVAYSRARAVHETGARLTHEIKNILHGLSIALALFDRGGDKAALARAQMSRLQERLEKTLAKIKSPPAKPDRARASAIHWWRASERRNAHESVEFSIEGAIDETAQIPTALFENALENYLANALVKRRADSRVRVAAALRFDGGGVSLRVSDSGVAARDAARLFAAPVESASGLGVGLYQLAREADGSGYAPRIAANRDGEVTFELAPRAAATD